MSTPELEFIIQVEVSTALGSDSLPFPLQDATIVTEYRNQMRPRKLRDHSRLAPGSSPEAATVASGPETLMVIARAFVQRSILFQFRALPDQYPKARFSRDALAVLAERPRLGLPIYAAYQTIVNAAIPRESQVRVESYPDPETGAFRHISVLVEIPGISYDAARELIDKLDAAIASISSEGKVVPDVYPL